MSVEKTFSQIWRHFGAIFDPELDPSVPLKRQILVEEEIERKVNSLKVRRGVSVRTVLVYDGILEPRVEGAGFFDAIVRAGKLLG